MGIVRKLLTRRMQRKNKFHDNHATREAMVKLVFRVLSGMRYVPDLPMFYLGRASTRFYAELGSAPIPNFFKVLKLPVHWDVRDTFFVWKFLSDLPFQLYSLQSLGSLEVQNAASSGKFLLFVSFWDSQITISCQGNGRFAQTLSHNDCYWIYFPIPN